MSLNGREMKARKLAVFAIVLDILTFTVGFGFVFIAIGHDANSATECATGNGKCPASIVPLGVWNNFPSNSSLPFCFAANITDSCELMSQTTSFPQILNTTYRGVSDPPLGQGGLSASLQVGCVKPSNTIGADLQLEYANYSSTTLTNSSLFVSLGSPVFIDNRANFPCPGNLAPVNAGNLPNLNAQFIFRVVGLNGGGIGDSPRFSSITVNLALSLSQIFTSYVTSRSTTSFTARIATGFRLSVAVAVTGYWIAFQPLGGGGNRTGTQNPFCTVTIGANFCITSPITFSPAFSVIPQVYITIVTSPGSVTEPMAVIPLLMVQTLTV